MFQVDKWRHKFLLAVWWTCQVSLDKVQLLLCYSVHVHVQTVLYKEMQANFDEIHDHYYFQVVEQNYALINFVTRGTCPDQIMCWLILKTLACVRDWHLILFFQITNAAECCVKTAVNQCGLVWSELHATTCCCYSGTGWAKSQGNQWLQDPKVLQASLVSLTGTSKF